LLGRAEQSSPNAAWRRDEGAGLDGEGSSRAIINVSQNRFARKSPSKGQKPANSIT
jgi:hypothetical protein